MNQKNELYDVHPVLKALYELVPKDVPTTELTQFEHGVRAGQVMLWRNLLQKLNVKEEELNAILKTT